MNAEKMQAQVENALCFVHHQAIEERIPIGAAKQLALFFGVPGNVEICGTDGDAVLVTGTKTSLGFTEEEAAQSTDAMGLHYDQVASFLDQGPHPAELFGGTNAQGEDGKPYSISQAMTAEEWKRQWSSEKSSGASDALFPASETERELQQLLIEAFDQPTVRLSVVREKMEDIAIPCEAFTPALRRALVPNSTDTGYVHGPRGVANLVVAVPAGVEVTLLGSGHEVHVWGLRSRVNLIGQRGKVRLEDLHGDVRLKSTSPSLVKGITGDVWWCDYDGSGVEWNNQIARRQVRESTVEDVCGQLRIEVGKLYLEVSGVQGTAKVRNGYGTTRYRIANHQPTWKHRIESESGEVKLFLKDGLWHELTVTLATRWGAVDYAVLGEFPLTASGNSPQRTIVSTARQNAWATALTDLDADIVVVTKNGDIALEKTT